MRNRGAEGFVSLHYNRNEVLQVVWSSCYLVAQHFMQESDSGVSCMKISTAALRIGADLLLYSVRVCLLTYQSRR